MKSKTPKPPYYAVIFTSVRSHSNEGYSEMSDELEKLVADQPGFHGFESARNEIGITVSYWTDLESIRMWKENPVHSIARQNGRARWYQQFKVRIAKVESDYDFKM